VETTNAKTAAWTAARMREVRRTEWLALRDFRTALVTGNVELLSSAIQQIEAKGLWRRAMLVAARLGTVPDVIRRSFLQAWLSSGDHIRQETSDDHALADGLRVLLPSYCGPGLTLYRGDSLYNRRRRTYGLSWTAERDCGAAFAQGIWQTFDGGSVLLCTEAPAASVICVPHLLGDNYGEAEYLVDRRRLGRVWLLRRYPQKLFPLS
jgi:hypothetical protein